MFISHHLTPLSLTSDSLQFFCLPLLKYVITEVLPPLPIVLPLASGGSILEVAGTGFIRHGGSFLQFLTEATPIAPHSTKTLPRKLITLYITGTGRLF